MSRVTAINQFYVAELPDLPNAEVGFGTPIDQIDSVVIPRFTTPAQRDARIVSPTAGMRCWATSTEEEYKYNGTAWVGASSKYRNVPAAGYGNIDTADFFELALAWPFEANSVYIGEINLAFFSTATGRAIKIALSGPSGSTVYGHSITGDFEGTADSEFPDVSYNQISTNGDKSHYGIGRVGNNSPAFWMKFWIQTSATAGSLSFKMNKQTAYSESVSWRGWSTCLKVG